VTPIPEADRFLDVREELELVFEVLGREQRAVVQLADVFHAIDDLDMALRVEEARVAGAEPAVAVPRLRGGARVLVVLGEQPRRADQQLALRAEFELDARYRGTDRVGLHLP